ncbi:MAG: hypothetical protein ACRDJY_10680 [Thermoleophilaceae bacterium]
MDFARLRFGDWVMGIGGLAVLLVMFLDWYGPPDELLYVTEGLRWNAWEAFAVNDVILAVAALLAIAAWVMTAVHPTAAVPLALASLAGIVSILALVLVMIRVIWPPDVFPDDVPLDTARETGAWLGLVATTVLTGGCLASIRDERLPEPEHPVEPRLVEP